MSRARRIFTGGWLGDALSVFTRGWFTRETGVTYIVAADIECRFVALADRETRLLTAIVDVEL